MNNFLLSITLIFSSTSFSQCIDLHISEYLSGDPICNFSRGEILSICEDVNEISGCPQAFYIQRVYTDQNGFNVYDFALDNVYYAQKYGELRVNPKSKKFAISIGNRTGIYSYYIENQLNTNSRGTDIPLSLDELLAAAAKERKQKEEQTRIEKETVQNKENDRKKYANIELLINQKNFVQAQNEINKLNYQKDFPKLNEFNSLYDEQKLQEIQLKIESNSFEEAVSLFETLKIQSNRDKVKNVIQSKLDGHFKNMIDSIPSDKYSKYINNNLAVFKVLNSGRYNLKIDREGKVYLNGNVIGANAEIAEKRFGSSFTVKVESETSLNISEVFIPQGEKKYLVSTQKPIFSKPNGKKYAGAFLGGPGYFASITGHIKLNSTYDQTISKNTLRTVQPSLKKIKINNSVEIPLEVQNVMVQEEKVKARAGVIIFRALGIAATSVGVFVAYLALL